MTYGNYPHLKNVKKALIVKLRHHGDVLLTSPVFSSLKRALPEATIDAVVYKETAPMLEGHPAIRALHLYDKAWKREPFFKKGFLEMQFLKQIRNCGYDLVMNLTEGDRGALIAAVSKAKIRVGIDPEKKGFWGKSKLFSHLVKPCKTPRHTVEKNLDALRRIGIFPEPENRDLTFFIPQEAQDKVIPLLPSSYIVIHPVSRWKFKCWPVESVAKLIQRLHQEGEMVVLTASSDPAELQMIKEIKRLCAEAPVIDLAGKISLKELGAVIEKAKALICVDSVPLHIASALKTPVVTLFGPTSEQNWGPWMHPQSQVVTYPFSCRPCGMDGCGGSKKSDCLERIPVEVVVRAFQKVIRMD